MSAFPVFQTTAATAAQLRFGLQLLQQVAAADASGNVAISPLGILAALALVRHGAGGTTKAALSDVLFGIGANPERAEVAFAGWLRQLLKLDDEPLEEDEPFEEADAILTLATSLWAAHPFVMAAEFTIKSKNLYGAEAASLNFASPEAAETVNEWARRHTRGRIQSVVSPASLAHLLPPALLLLNAVYFRARWASEFDASATRPGPFLLASGVTQEAQFMQQVSTEIRYLAGEDWQAVSLPYISLRRSFSMLVFHPDQPTGLSSFVAGLTTADWQSWHRAFRNAPHREVDLTFPRFLVEWNADLVPALRQLGLANIFMPDADFSALGYQAEAGGGFIDSVLHKAFLEVDEKGTEAAAVTVVMAMGGGAYEPEIPPRVVVKVDSPFFYAIVDEADGTLLFAGTVNKPG